MTDKKFNKIFILFIVFSLLIFIEGFSYYYSQKLFFYFDHSNYFQLGRFGYNPLIWNENGFVETLQVLLLFFSIINFIYIIKITNDIKFMPIVKFFSYTYILGLLYFFFEEISWGQHIFNWDAGNFFTTYNHQNETNIHNISNLFNELPRSILILWCTISFIFIKIFSNKISKITYLNKFILPSYNLKYISIYLLIFFIPYFVVDKMDLHPGHAEQHAELFLINDLFDILTFNFIKLSEYHELIITYYLLFHSIYLKDFFCSIKKNTVKAR